ncbi:MAG: hypothetical protein HYX52_03640 [Chloroflexi bacterium]|nr:hypothetical protein [Chloroflexota bacterium]
MRLFPRIFALFIVLLAAACQPNAPAATPTSAPAPKPTAAPTAAPAAAAAASPAASPAAASPASPSPASAPAASPVASPSPAAAGAAPKPLQKPNFDEQAVATFYRGKTVTIVVGYTPGGGYDEYARFLSRSIGRYIPGNPTIIVQNQPGAGSMLAANTLFNASPKDGTVFGTFARGLPAEELLGSEGVQYKSAQFNWIGSMNDEVSICIARTDAPVKKFEDLYTMPLKIGGTGPGADTDFFPKFLNGLLGTKFDLATGYPGGNDINVAMERGEVQGRCGFSYSSLISTRPQWITDKFITILVQMSLNKHPDLPSVPLVTDLARNAEERQLMRVVFSRQTMGRPFAAPPGVPADRVAALRYAFDQTMRDPQFMAEAQQAKLEVNPAGGTDLQQIVQDVLATPPDLARKLADLVK